MNTRAPLKNPTPVYRDFLPGDEKPIADLYRAVFKKERTFPEWQWEFMDPPEGPANIRLIEMGGKVIGHIALIPLRFQYLDREIIVGKSEDSSLHPSYQGKRLFGKLEHGCFDTAAEKGVSVSYSISRTARAVHLKAGYSPLRPMEGRFVPINPVKVTRELQKAMHLPPWAPVIMKPIMQYLAYRFKARLKRKVEYRTYRIAETDHFDSSFDTLWQKFTGQHRLITIKRSSDYLSWRFLKNPNRRYRIFKALFGHELVGYLVTTAVRRKGDFNADLTIGVTSDYLILDSHREALAPLFDRAVQDWMSRSCDCVINWIHRESLHANIMLKQLDRYGFISMFGKFSIPISVRALRDDVAMEDLKNGKNWYLTLAFSGRWA